MPWSEKYKRSIDCNNPKGFSQRAHCLGRKKKKKKLDEIILENLRKWFKEKWVDISRKEGGKHPPCGASAGEGEREKDHFRAYPKCLPKHKAKNLSKKEKEIIINRKRRKVRKDKTKSTPVWVSSKPKIK